MWAKVPRSTTSGCDSLRSTHDDRAAAEHDSTPLQSGCKTERTRVRDGDGKRVRRVFFGHDRKPEHHRDDARNLEFASLTCAYDRTLHASRRVFTDLQTGTTKHHHRNSTRVPKFRCTLGILRKKQGLNRGGLGSVKRQNLDELSLQRHQPVRQLAASQAKGAVRDVQELRAHAFNDAPTAQARTWIDANHSHPARS